ncbi:unnamed protein product [Prorocentrum cordatum]|uniref:Ion transport domain-containing protein n=1 Tax=Prorocentrum cordatum TaxID=2364126 RepID=A0ABN9T589_9DINO|nr:unnamed protein product [Polarella glacialis]
MSLPGRTVSFFPGDGDDNPAPVSSSFDAFAYKVALCLEPTREAARDQTVVVRAVAHVEAALSLTDSGARRTLSFDTRTAASAYLFIRRSTRLRVAALLLYVLMGLVERPWYCEKSFGESGLARSELCPGGRPTEDLSIWPPVTLPTRWALLLALLLQGLLLADSAIHLLARLPRQRARYFCIGLLTVSAAEVLLRLALPALAPARVWPYRIVRPLALAAGSSRIRNGIERVALAAWCARWLYLGVAISIFISTWMARVYFFDQGAPFDTYAGTLRAMFTVMTTANYPDVQTPITNQGGISWLSFLFFASFLVIHIYVLLNIVFSDIYVAASGLSMHRCLGGLHGVSRGFSGPGLVHVALGWGSKQCFGSFWLWEALAAHP